MTTFRSLPQPSDQLDDALVKDMNREFKLAAHIQTALDTIMDNHARAMPAYHRHSCECGDYYVCSQERDACDDHWTCPSCLERQMDEFFQGGR